MAKNKKRKRQHALFHAVKARVSDLNTADESGGDNPVVAKNEPAASELNNNNNNNVSNDISESELSTTLQTLQRLVENPQIFHSKRFKHLRRTLHPLVVEQLQSYDKGVDYRHKVTLALQHHHWSDALAALKACRDFQQWPKQGTIQRWVRDCTDADTAQMQLLQAILRVSESTAFAENKHDAGQALADHLAKPGVKQQLKVMKGWKWWSPDDIDIDITDDNTDNDNGDDDDDDDSSPEAATQKVVGITKPTQIEGLASRILYQEAAATRTPPNHFDLLLHVTTDPTIFPWDTMSKPSQPVEAHPVPFLPKPARVLSHVLSSEECGRLLDIMTTLGYRPDHPTQLDQPTGIDSCEWMMDASIRDVIFQRVQPHLPAILELPNKKKVQLHSINPRWRCFRYGQDCVYRPHLDGSWPQSLVDEEGQYQCPKQSDIKSYLTFLIYLNDDFEGGETRYYLPNGVARGIVPRQGCVMVFPQGNLASLIHEGALVTNGTKYVVRTDVLYQPFVEEDDVAVVAETAGITNSSDSVRDEEGANESEGD